MKKSVFFATLITAIMFTSCETDIETNAEYKDMTIVYGLLDPTETDHYIKINKGFIGNANANDLANDANNYNYTNGEISVKIDEFKPSGVFVDEHKLDRVVNDIPKDNGIFDNATNVLYKFTKAGLNTDNIYKLSIYNIALEKIVSAETDLVKLPYVSPFNELKLRNSTGTSLKHTFDVTPGENLGRIKAEFIFNYTEHRLEDENGNPSTIDTVVENKSIRISMGEELATDLQGNNLSFDITGNALFSAIESKIPTTTPNLYKRQINNATVEYTLAGVDLSTYMSVNDPALGSQDKLGFTNINNGLGLFSSRVVMRNTSIDGVYNPDLPNYDGRLNLNEHTLKKIITMGREFCTEIQTGSGSSPQNICQ
jgi:hypothetical protein